MTSDLRAMVNFVKWMYLLIITPMMVWGVMFSNGQIYQVLFSMPLPFIFGEIVEALWTSSSHGEKIGCKLLCRVVGRVALGFALYAGFVFSVYVGSYLEAS